MQHPAASDDPLELGELNPELIQARIDARESGKKGKEPTQLEREKEARLAQKEARLNGTPSAAKGKQPPPSAPPTTPLPPQVNKSLLLDKIAAYRERFPHLKKRNNNVSAKSTVDEILDELHYCELQLGSASGGPNIGATVLYGTLVGLERFTDDYWNPLGLRLTGLGTVAQQNMAEFQPIIDELMIKHNAGAYTSPEWRLALAIGATVVTVHAANSNPEMARAVKSMNQAVNVPKDAKDL